MKELYVPLANIDWEKLHTSWNLLYVLTGYIYIYIYIYISVCVYVYKALPKRVMEFDY